MNAEWIGSSKGQLTEANDTQADSGLDYPVTISNEEINRILRLIWDVYNTEQNGVSIPDVVRLVSNPVAELEEIQSQADCSRESIGKKLKRAEYNLRMAIERVANEGLESGGFMGKHAVFRNLARFTLSQVLPPANPEYYKVQYLIQSGILTTLDGSDDMKIKPMHPWMQRHLDNTGQPIDPDNPPRKNDGTPDCFTAKPDGRGAELKVVSEATWAYHHCRVCGAKIGAKNGGASWVCRNGCAKKAGVLNGPLLQRADNREPF